MKLLVFIFTSIFIVSCVPKPTPYNMKPENYKCSKEQLKLVQEELTICNSTNYTSDYCFLQAKKSICDYIAPAENNKWL